MNIENSQRYDGEVLGGSGDLRTDACCTMEAPPPAIRAALVNVHEEVRARYYGCGPVVPEAIALDPYHLIEAGRVVPVCGNTARMLADTRFARRFEFFGDKTRHYGVFARCGAASPFIGTQADGNAMACC